jgi:hypothetical protein
MKNLISLTRDEPKIQLLQAMGSNNKKVAAQAQEIFAAFSAQLIQQVLNQMPTHKLIYGEPLVYNTDNGDPMIPLEYFHDIQEGAINIWAQGSPGALPTNEIAGPVDEFRLRTYQHSTAVSMKKCYARQSRFDVVSKVLERVLQEFVVKTEYQAWSPLLRALASNRTNGDLQIITSTQTGQLTFDDFNRLWTKVCRFRQSWSGGTPTASPCKGLTDLFVSCELLENIRSFAYNPANTAATPNTDESTALGLPDAMRMSIFNNSGMASIFGVNIISLLELGVGQAWDELFNSFYAPGGGDPTKSAVQELAVGVDLSCDAFASCVGQNPCEPAPLVFLPDDQFSSREEKLGFYASLRAGYSVIDAKALVGLIV